MTINYDKERRKKEDKEGQFLGSYAGLLTLIVIDIVLASVVACWLTIGIEGTRAWATNPYIKMGLHQSMSGGVSTVDILGPLITPWSVHNIANYHALSQYPKMFLLVEAVLMAAFLPLIIKTWRRWKPRNTNQYGNDRLASEGEVLRQYPQIPDREYCFPSYGGIPVSHIKPGWQFFSYHPGQYIRSFLFPYVKQFFDGNRPAKGFYSIDQTTVNSLIVGITRSGKGETLVTPLIDILSRAKKKCSMVINDPKGELYQMSYKTLRKRGYGVQVLNLNNTDFSASYNPLEQIKELARAGYYDETQEAINSLSTSIYTKRSSSSDSNAAFWQNSSINLLNSLILAIIDYAQRNDKWAEVTMDNAVHMMTGLGQEEVFLDANGDIITSGKAVSQKNKLLVYFAKMQKLQSKNYSKWRQMALDAFSQSKFAGEETSGNIYSSAMEGIKIYLQSNIAKLTSLNSINFEKIGFPRMLKVQLPKKYQFNTAVVFFSTQEGTIIEKRNTEVDKLGRINYAIKAKLPDKFVLKISFNFRKNPTELRRDSITFSSNKHYYRKGLEKDNYKVDPYDHRPILKNISLNEVENKLSDNADVDVKINYSERPVALFLVTPPNNPAYNQLPAFAVDQAFNILWGIAQKNGRKLFTRTHFILDEFGNMPTINNMAGKVSIGLGAEMLFDIVVQNLEQLRINYDKDTAATIESNCSNILYILTNSNETAQSISHRIGKRTVDVSTKSGRMGHAQSTNYNRQAMSQDILSPTELLHFMGGEMAVIRSVYRQDTRGNSVASYPIFDHGQTQMPYRNTFLEKDFNDQTTLADIGIKAQHRSLELEQLRIDFDAAYDQLLLLFDDQQAEQESVGVLLDGLNDQVSQEANNQDVATSTILTSQQLMNEALLNDINQVVTQISGSLDSKNQLTNSFWKDPKHNSWSYLEKLCSNSQLYEEARSAIEARIQQYEEAE